MDEGDGMQTAGFVGPLGADIHPDCSQTDSYSQLETLDKGVDSVHGLLGMLLLHWLLVAEYFMSLVDDY